MELRKYLVKLKDYRFSISHIDTLGWGKLKSTILILSIIESRPSFSYPFPPPGGHRIPTNAQRSPTADHRLRRTQLRHEATLPLWYLKMRLVKHKNNSRKC